MKCYYLLHSQQLHEMSIIITYFFVSTRIEKFLFSFLQPHLQHMEVLGLGVELELQLQASTRATSTSDLSCICKLCSSLWQCQILSPTNQIRLNLHPHRDVRSLACWTTTGTPRKEILKRVLNEDLGQDFRGK